MKARPRAVVLTMLCLALTMPGPARAGSTAGAPGSRPHSVEGRTVSLSAPVTSDDRVVSTAGILPATADPATAVGNATDPSVGSAGRPAACSAGADEARPSVSAVLEATEDGRLVSLGDATVASGRIDVAAGPTVGSPHTFPDFTATVTVRDAGGDTIRFTRRGGEGRPSVRGEIDTAALPDGPTTVSVDIVGGAGAEWCAGFTKTFVVDNGSPAVTPSAAGRSAVLCSAGTLEVAAGYADTTLRRYAITVRGPQGTVVASASGPAPDAPAGSSPTGNLTRSLDLASLADGEYTVFFTAKDALDHETTTARTFTVDSSGPRCDWPGERDVSVEATCAAGTARVNLTVENPTAGFLGRLTLDGELGSSEPASVEPGGATTLTVDTGEPVLEAGAGEFTMSRTTVPFEAGLVVDHPAVDCRAGVPTAPAATGIRGAALDRAVAEIPQAGDGVSTWAGTAMAPTPEELAEVSLEPIPTPSGPEAEATRDPTAPGLASLAPAFPRPGAADGELGADTTAALPVTGASPVPLVVLASILIGLGTSAALVRRRDRRA